MPRTLEEVRQRMLSAWEGVHPLHATARKKVYWTTTSVRHNTPHFLESDAATIKPYHYEAWWHGPDHWRHDNEIPSHPITLPHQRISYIAVGDRRWTKDGGVVKRTGTVAEAQQQELTKGDALWYGRPY